MTFALSPPDCTNKTVLVAGGAQGLGQSIVVTLAEAGAARIAVLDGQDASATRTRALQAASGAGRPALEVDVLQVDVCDAGKVEACIQKLGARWGHVDILINIAGSPTPSSSSDVQPTQVSDVETWWRAWELNIKGAYSVTHSVLPLLLRGSERTVVNVLSAEPTSAKAGASAQQLSELAVMRLSESLTLDYAHEGLLGYSVQPGSGLAVDNQAPEVPDAKRRDQLRLMGEAVVSLVSQRREWLGGKHVRCTRNERQLGFSVRKDGSDLAQSQAVKIPAAEKQYGEGIKAQGHVVPQPQRSRGRVPRSSY